MDDRRAYRSSNATASHRFSALSAVRPQFVQM